MKRAENFVNAQIEHIYFKYYSLVFGFAKSKGHQDVEDNLGPWNVCANPKEPWICPLLYFSIYPLTYP